jgi:hypothetical protein
MKYQQSLVINATVKKSITNNQFQIDHIKPLGAGGDNNDDNVNQIAEEINRLVGILNNQ